MMSRGEILLPMRRTAALPVSSAATRRSEWTAGMAAVPGSDMPSFRKAGHRGSGAHHGACAGRDRQPAFDLFDFLLVDRPCAIFRPEGAAVGAAPSLCPLCRPVDIGPVTTWIAGTFADAAPINCAGTVLSQPPISTTESIGCAEIISVSIAIRLRYIMLVGLRNTSPSETVGNGMGIAPAASTPRDTASTRSGMGGGNC